MSSAYAAPSKLVKGRSFVPDGIHSWVSYALAMCLRAGIVHLTLTSPHMPPKKKPHPKRAPVEQAVQQALNAGLRDIAEGRLFTLEGGAALKRPKRKNHIPKQPRIVYSAGKLPDATSSTIFTSQLSSYTWPDTRRPFTVSDVLPTYEPLLTFSTALLWAAWAGFTLLCLFSLAALISG